MSKYKYSVPDTTSTGSADRTFLLYRGTPYFCTEFCTKLLFSFPLLSSLFSHSLVLLAALPAPRYPWARREGNSSLTTLKPSFSSVFLFSLEVGPDIGYQTVPI
ncbi:hypothetical protein ACN38_g1176 [Penicillium nordicum]|uniref:Uncharacterized protein n=1 Tax=Penicillium nordicum TaxID=229535 RepID=A0A0M8PFY8_9EURO|nr:hypothetical protein ACN38_g1176 [Penicillium nordicum]